jgi:hypothetical protein
MRPGRRQALTLALLITTAFLSAAHVLADGLPLHARIDQVIAAAEPSSVAAPASDDEFVRRVYLDLVGRIPSVAELEAFRSSPAGQRRSELIDALLKSDECNQHLAAVFDVMFMERRPDKYVTTGEWRRYLVDSFAANKPFNHLAAEMIAASGDAGEQRAPAKFLLEREVESNAITRDVSRMFFGRDVQCAQCHDHPIVSDYLQAEYYGLESFLSRSFRFEKPGENNMPVSLVGERAEGDLTFSSVFEPDAEKVTAMPALPDGRAIDDEPVYAAEQAYLVAAGKDVRPVPRYSRRAQLARLAADGRSDLFRINIANRLWRLLIKRGLVEPPDFIHSENPASYPLLLHELGDAFADMNFDIKEYLRQVALSGAYQRSIALPDSLLDNVDETAGKLPSWRQQRAFQEEVAMRSEQTFQQAAGRLQTTRRKVLETRQAMAANLQHSAEIQKQKAEADQELREVQERRDKAAALAQTLQQAVEKTEAASQQRADDEPLRTVAQTLGQRAEAANQELLAIDQKLSQLQASAKQADTSLAEHSQAFTALQNTLNQLASRAQEESGEFRALKHCRDVEVARLVDLQHKIRFAEQAVALRDAEQALDDRIARRESLTAEPDAEAAERLQAVDAACAAVAEAQTQVQQQQDRLRELMEQRCLVAVIAPLSPEQLAASVVCALNLGPRLHAEGESQWQGQHKDTPADQIDDQQRQQEIESIAAERRRQLESSFVSLFAATPGSPQDTFFSTVDQALFMANDGRMQDWINPQHDNLAARLQQSPSAEVVAAQLYRSVLTREPAPEEQTEVVEYLSTSQDDRAAAIQELIWGLLTSIEFRFHH